MQRKRVCVIGSKWDIIYGVRSLELREHMFFKGVDWEQVYQLKYPPPLIPPRGEVNAADAFDIGSFDEEDTKGVKVRDLLFHSVLFQTLNYLNVDAGFTINYTLFLYA